MGRTRTNEHREKDRKLAEEGRLREKSGKPMTAIQLRASERLKADEFWELLTNMSTSMFQELSTLSAKQRIDWQERYGIPCGRGQNGIDLQQVFIAFRAHFKKNRLILNTKDGSGEFAREKAKKELELKDEQIRKMRTQSLVNEGQYVRVEVMHERMVRMATMLRNLGDQFARKKNLSGAESQKMLNNVIKNFAREIEQMK